MFDYSDQASSISFDKGAIDRGVKVKTIPVTKLKQYLKTMDEAQLRLEVVNLYKMFPAVKEYYSVHINPELGRGLLEKYKNIIEKEFIPIGDSVGLKYKNCRNAIKSFEKVCNDKKLVAKLMFYYAGVGIEFTNDYGDINEQFYSNIVSAYFNAIKYCFENGLDKDYRDEALALMHAGQGIGWGFSDNLRDIYYEYYFEDDEGE